jgi:hypothetical protein
VPQIYSTVDTDRADLHILESATDLAVVYGKTGVSGNGWGGFSVSPNTTHRFSVVGRVCTVQIAATTGTSNSTGLTFTFPIPGSASNLSNGQMRAADNGAYSGTLGQWIGTQNSTTVTCYRDNAGNTAWTASGAKGINGTFVYEI